MTEDYTDVTDNPEFLEFVNHEFNKTARNATVEELVEFAFGSLEEGVKAFQHYCRSGPS